MRKAKLLPIAFYFGGNTTTNAGGSQWGMGREDGRQPEPIQGIVCLL